MLMTGVLVSTLLGQLCAQNKTPRPLTDRERSTFVGRHRQIVARLVAAGLTRREDPVGHIGQDGPNVRVILPDSRGRSVERVSVDDDFLGTTFRRDSGEVVGVLNRALSNWRGVEREKGTRFPFVLTRERVQVLIDKYVTAIEGREPDGPGGVDESGLAQISKTAERTGHISSDEEIHAEWPRLYEGFPFRNDSTSLAISAVNGELISYTRRWNSLPPPTVRIEIPPDDAVKVAMQMATEDIRRKGTVNPTQKIRLNDGEGRLFASREGYEEALARKRDWLKQEAAAWARYVGVEPMVAVPPKAMIVNPNVAFTDEYHNDAGERDRWSPQTRLAWAVKVQYRPNDVEGAHHRLEVEVWVDAEDGKVLGGVVPY